MVHQLRMLDARTDANEITSAGVAGETGTDWFSRSCGYPTPSIVINATTFGIHATLSYL